MPSIQGWPLHVCLRLFVEISEHEHVIQRHCFSVELSEWRQNLASSVINVGRVQCLLCLVALFFFVRERFPFDDRRNSNDIFESCFEKKNFAYKSANQNGIRHAEGCQIFFRTRKVSIRSCMSVTSCNRHGHVNAHALPLRTGLAHSSVAFVGHPCFNVGLFAAVVAPNRLPIISVKHTLRLILLGGVTLASEFVNGYVAKRWRRGLRRLLPSCSVPIRPNRSQLFWCPCQCEAVAQFNYAGAVHGQPRRRRACADSTVERTRFLCSWFREHPEILTPSRAANRNRSRTRSLGVRAVRVLHAAPENALARALNLADNPFIDYVTGDFFVTPTATAKGWVEHKIDLQAVPFPDSHFDVAIVLHVLEHVPNATRAISEIYRTLRPGGLAIVAVPDARSNATTQEGTVQMTETKRLELFGQVDHLRRFGRDFKRILAAPGFRPVQPVSIGKWYAKRPESRLFRNHEYDRTQRHYYDELVFFAHKPFNASM